jgi:pimeloyl-ACP methyl ester carboxylesterase
LIISADQNGLRDQSSDRGQAWMLACGHLLAEERPDEVAEALRSFLA